MNNFNIQKNFREYIKKHPRKRTPFELTSSARIAVALPYGYMCDSYQFLPFPHLDKTFKIGRMWWSYFMALNKKNKKGKTYKEILKKAISECAKLLKSKTPYDFIFLKRNQKPEGYEKIIFIKEDGNIKIIK